MHLWDGNKLDLFTLQAIADGDYVGFWSRRKGIYLGFSDAIEGVWGETLV